MKALLCCATLILLLTPLAGAAETAPAQEAAAAELARLIHKAIVAKMPPVYEDRSAWGHTIPLPDRLIVPRLKRTLLQVGERMEVPDGPWRKLRVRMENPERDLQVHVRSFKKVDAMTYRVLVEVDAAVQTEGELQSWRNGFQLTDLTARADVALNVLLECDVAARLDAGRVPPRLLLEPEVRDLKLNLKEFTPRQVTFRRAGLTVQGAGLEAAGEEFKGGLQDLLRTVEPEVKKRAGDALARAMKEGKDPLTAATLLRTIAPLLKDK